MNHAVQCFLMLLNVIVSIHRGIVWLLFPVVLVHWLALLAKHFRQWQRHEPWWTCNWPSVFIPEHALQWPSVWSRWSKTTKPHSFEAPSIYEKNISLLTVVLLFLFFVCLLYSKARIFLRCGWRTVGSHSSNPFWWMLFIGRCSMTLHSESLVSLVNSLPSMYVCCYRQDSVLVGMLCWWCCCPEKVLVYFKVIWYHFIMCICSCAFLLTQFYVFRPFLPLLL